MRRSWACRLYAYWRCQLLSIRDGSPRRVTVSRNTLNFALPESMRAYVDARVASGHYGNTSE